jgi:hypothetical protein
VDIFRSVRSSETNTFFGLGAHTENYVYQRKNQVPRRRTYPISTGHTFLSPISRSCKWNNPQVNSVSKEWSNYLSETLQTAYDLMKVCSGIVDRYVITKISGLLPVNKTLDILYDIK